MKHHSSHRRRLRLLQLDCWASILAELSSIQNSVAAVLPTKHLPLIDFRYCLEHFESGFALDGVAGTSLAVTNQLLSLTLELPMLQLLLNEI